MDFAAVANVVVVLKYRINTEGLFGVFITIVLKT